MSSLPTEIDPLEHPDNLFNRLSGLLPPEKKEERAVLPAEAVHRRLQGKGRAGNNGRPPGKSVTLTEQILIGTAARLEGTTKAAKAFGVSITTADGYKDGSTQQGKKDAAPHPVLKPALDEVLGKAKEVAADRILKSIQMIDSESLGTLKKEPLRAASVASTLANVVEKLTPRREGNDNRVQVVVYDPGERAEDRYERIQVPLTAEER